MKPAESDRHLIRYITLQNNLNEKNRADTLSIMWEIMQAKIVKQKAEMTEE